MYNNMARLILCEKVILQDTNMTRTDKAGTAVSSFLGRTHRCSVTNLNNASSKASANKLQKSLVDPMLAALLFGVPQCFFKL